jgi:hypothetical protein
MEDEVQLKAAVGVIQRLCPAVVVDGGGGGGGIDFPTGGSLEDGVAIVATAAAIVATAVAIVATAAAIVATAAAVPVIGLNRCPWVWHCARHGARLGARHGALCGGVSGDGRR